MLCPAREQPMACCWPSQCYEIHPPHPLWNQGMRSSVPGGSCLFLHLSSQLARPEWNSRVILCRVGDWEMTRMTGTNWHILPSFKIVCWQWQRLHILIWLSLLSFSKTEAKSGKSCFLFKCPVKVSIHKCLQCSLSVTQMPIKWGRRLLGGTRGYHLIWPEDCECCGCGAGLLTLTPCYVCPIVFFRRSTSPPTTLCHPCVRWCWGAIAEGLWGTNSSLLPSVLDQEPRRQPLGASSLGSAYTRALSLWRREVLCAVHVALCYFLPLWPSSHLSCITVFRNSSLKIVIMGSSGQRFALLSIQRKGFYLSQRFLLLLEKITNERHGEHKSNLPTNLTSEHQPVSLCWVLKMMAYSTKHFPASLF